MNTFSPVISNTPVGSVIMYGGATAPTDWVLCDGSAISRTTYAALFAVLSTTYGVGDGSTTFNVPDCRGVFVRGAGSQTISSISYTGTRGTTQGDTLQGHKHAITSAQTQILNYATAGGLDNNVGNRALETVVIGSPTDDGTNGTPRTGSETRPANIVLSYIIKAV